MNRFFGNGHQNLNPWADESSEIPVKHKRAWLFRLLERKKYVIVEVRDEVVLTVPRSELSLEVTRSTHCSDANIAPILILELRCFLLLDHDVLTIPP